MDQLKNSFGNYNFSKPKLNSLFTVIFRREEQACRKDIQPTKGNSSPSNIRRKKYFKLKYKEYFECYYTL